MNVIEMDVSLLEHKYLSIMSKECPHVLAL